MEHRDRLTRANCDHPAQMVRNFTSGTVRDVERNHGVILDPLETSLAKLVTANKPLWYITGKDIPGFMNLVSRPTQIVIFPDPGQFYVPESNNKKLEAQRQLLEVDDVEVIEKKMGIGGLREVIGDVATHAGLVFAYFDRTRGKVRLHGKDYGYNCGRTETPTVGSLVAVVGDFNADCGLHVHSWFHDYGFDFVWAVRLGVPAQE